MYYSLNMYGKHLRTVDIWNNKEKHFESTVGAKVWHSTTWPLFFVDIFEKAEHPSHFWYTPCLSHFCETVWCYLICCFYRHCFFLSIYAFTYFFLLFLLQRINWRDVLYCFLTVWDMKNLIWRRKKRRWMYWPDPDTELQSTFGYTFVIPSRQQHLTAI